MADVDRFTQVGVEVLGTLPAGEIRVTQVGVEVLGTLPAGDVRFTQVGVEVMSNVGGTPPGAGYFPIVMVMS